MGQQQLTPMRRNYSYLTLFIIFLLFCAYQFSSGQPALGTRGGSASRIFGQTGGNKPFSGHSFSNNPSLDDTTLTETTIPGGSVIPGFSLLDHVYLRKGTFYIVTSELSRFPPRDKIIARPLDIGVGHELQPTDRELRFITPAGAKDILGERALLIDGFSLLISDTEQYMNRFYNWWGEIIFGAWRVFSALPFPSSVDPLSLFPHRIILPHIISSEWRDTPGLNPALMRTSFPSTAIEKFDYWNDLATLDKTFVFERVMIISREAAATDHPSVSPYNMIFSTIPVNSPESFWEPMRRHIIQGVLNYLPEINQRGAIVSPPSVISGIPFVTYIERQSSARRLLEADHDGLVKALKELEDGGICHVYIVQMEKLSLEQQIEIVARSTILVGVHGNGLTHQLWMPKLPSSAVIEIFAPGSYVHDYEILARILGRKHYAVWNDTLITYPKGKYYEGYKYTDNFHGLSIPAYGPAVAEVIKQRLVGLVSE